MLLQSWLCCSHSMGCKLAAVRRSPGLQCWGMGTVCRHRIYPLDTSLQENASSCENHSAEWCQICCCSGGSAAWNVLVCRWMLDTSFWHVEAVMNHFSLILNTSMSVFLCLFLTCSSCLAITLGVFPLSEVIPCHIKSCWVQGDEFCVSLLILGQSNPNLSYFRSAEGVNKIARTYHFY